MLIKWPKVRKEVPIKRTSVTLDAVAVYRLDGLARTINLTREQNVMEFIKCFLPKARVEIERLTVES